MRGAIGTLLSMENSIVPAWIRAHTHGWKWIIVAEENDGMVNRMYIVNDDIPLGCVYEGENGKTKYCPMLNHDDVPYCQYLEDDEAAIGIDERPVYCPIVELPSADAVDVVRCKDCKHYDLAKNGFNGVCNRQYATFYADDFCSYGERK